MDYSNHPPTVNEIKSDKSNNGSDWTARDALIAMLREIDAGRLEIETLFIAASTKTTSKGGSSALFSVAAANPIGALGCIELAKARYLWASHGN